MTEQDLTPPDHSRVLGHPTRRTVLAAAGLAGIGAAALAGCGGGGDDAGGSGGDAGGGDGGTISVSDVPVGGGVINAAQRVVVTQPAEGEFKAFSAVCPHEGCLVSRVADGTITCSTPCGHGSSFDASTGAVKTGPATRGLSPMTVTASGDTLTVS